MKVITLWMPWAFLCVTREKEIETRSRPYYYRGPLAIHASQNFPPHIRELCLQEPFRSALAKHGINNPCDLLPLLGHILGKVEKTDCVPMEMLCKKPECLDPKELAFGDYSDGRFAWILENGVRFEKPIRAKGSQGIWHYA